MRNQAILFSKYFGDMSIDKKQKEDREKFAEQFTDGLLLLFSLFKINLAMGNEDTEQLKEVLTNEYLALVSQYAEIDTYTRDYVTLMVSEIVKTTINNAKPVNLDKINILGDEPEEDEEDWYLSEDRAKFIAENEANAILNYADFLNAYREGKTKKIWIGIEDNRQRFSHYEVTGEMIDIDMPFEVGDSMMMYPKDISLGATPEEIVNCRCSIKYV